mgnify:CR=1 FL=1
MDLQGIQTALEVGTVHNDPAVKPAGTQQGFVQNFRAVGGGQAHHTLGGVEAIDLSQKLVQSLLLLTVTPQTGIPGPTYGVNFVNENDTGGHLRRLQVTNSLGDTAIVPLSVIMQENGKLPSIALQEYLVYLKQGDRFDPESYLLRVTELIAGRERTCPLDEVSIDSKVDMDHPGVYEVTYQYTGEAGTG